MIEGTGYTKELLMNKGLNLRKSLGQNFLIDQNISDKMVRLSDINSALNVLEIGPGAGALTSFLCKAANQVLAIELDNRLIPVLEDVLKEYNNFNIINGDVLKLDLKNIVKQFCSDKQWVVCANLPYNITTPVIIDLFESGAFTFITVMIQREVARRIVAKPGTADYGAFTVFVNYYSEPEILFDVPPDCFRPKPKVFSSVVKMKMREKSLLLPDDEKFFFKIVRSAFSQRRKTLVNALHSAFTDSFSKAELTDIVIKSGFDSQIRGEMLSIDDFMTLSGSFPYKGVK